MAPVRIEVVPTFAAALARIESGVLATLAVDMPVGLPAAGPRQADRAARRRLGPRRSSVFATPVRAALGAADYPDALRRSRAVDGRGLSAQAFHLLAKIAEVDAAMTPAAQDRVVESHPEIGFARLAGHPLATRKADRAGRTERAALLRPHLIGADGSDVDDLAGDRRPGVAPDDVLDALVLTLTARRLAAGRCEHLGDGAVDERGLRMEIVV